MISGRIWEIFNRRDEIECGRFGNVFEGKKDERAEDVRSSTLQSVFMKENEKNHN